MPDVMAPEELYLSNFRERGPDLTANDPEWLGRLRQEALQRFGELGFPTVHHEEWRFTNLAPLTRIPFQPAREEDAKRPDKIEPAWVRNLSDHRLVFVNGYYCQALSSVTDLPPAVQVGSLAAALRKDGEQIEAHLARYADHRSHPFVALNTAFWQDGAYLRFPKGMILEKPVHVLFLSTAGELPLVSFPRSLIVVEREAQVTVVESYWRAGSNVCFSNAVSEIVVGENAALDHYKLLGENDRSFHMAMLQVYQDRNANFSSCSVSLGGSLARNEVNAVLDAEGAECFLNGLYLAQGNQVVDNHTTLDHAKPHGASRELYHGILDGRATAVFNGRILVRPGAQKTDAIQKNRNLLLSKDAVIDTKPQLEIYNNDVRCTHGATIGQMDAEALFYLRSRGIGQEEARNLLIYAFAGDILERIRPAAVRAGVEEALHTLLAQGLSRKEDS